MAKTLTYGNIFNLLAPVLSRPLEADHAANIANSATNLIWNAHDFRETIATLPPFYLIPGAQDHGSPAAIIPSNFQGLRQVFLVDLSSIPPTRKTLPILIGDLELVHEKAYPKNISYQANTRSFRIFPRVPDNMGSPINVIEGKYKTLPTKLTSATYPTAVIPFDDQYQDVIYEAAKWAAYKFFDNPKAGGVTVQGRQRVYTGQFAVAQEALDWMATNEGLNLGDPPLAPSQAIMGSRNPYDGAFILTGGF